MRSWTTRTGVDVHHRPEQRYASEPRHLGALPEQLRRPRAHRRPGIGSFIGPIQAYTFIVPTAEFATQTAIPPRRRTTRSVTA